MNEHEATEIAYKNGYAKGKADATRELLDEFEDLILTYVFFTTEITGGGEVRGLIMDYERFTEFQKKHGWKGRCEFGKIFEVNEPRKYYPIGRSKKKYTEGKRDKEKQIEEKTKVISDICPLYKEYGSCEQCETELDVDDEPCYWECMANAIIRYGYRKASDVAREMLADLKAAGIDENRYPIIAELKKKYTEEGK